MLVSIVTLNELDHYNPFLQRYAGVFFSPTLRCFASDKIQGLPKSR